MNNLLPTQTQATTPAQPAQSVQQTAPAQAPAENPLDQLRDIHLPDQVDQFPFAPGWWILLAILLITLAYYLYRLYRRQQALRLLKPAKTEIAELRSLQQEQINAHAIAKLSALLKRVCLLYFPRILVASLNGHNWLNFLNDQAKFAHQNQSYFSDADIHLFSKAAYQANPDIAKQDWLRLLVASENCIESIIRTAAKNKTSVTRPSNRQLQAQSGGQI